MTNIAFILIFLVGVFVSAVSQLLLKQSANQSYSSKTREYLNSRVIIAYILFFGAALISIIAYSRLALSLGAALESAGYVFVLALGVLVLKEKISLKKAVGVLLIVTGIVFASIF